MKSDARDPTFTDCYRSPYNNPLVPIKEKNSSFRLRLDFRLLNEIRDVRCPLSHIYTILHWLGRGTLVGPKDSQASFQRIINQVLICSQYEHMQMVVQFTCLWTCFLSGNVEKAKIFLQTV